MGRRYHRLAPRQRVDDLVPIDEKEFETVIDEFLDEAVDTIFSESQNNIIKGEMSDTGAMLVRGNVNREFLSKEIVYPEPQSVWKEFGTQPHPVSKKGRENIAKWAQRKLGLSKKEAERASWGIANKIRKFGMSATPFLRPALDFFLVYGVSK